MKWVLLLPCKPLNSHLTVTRQSSVMMGTLRYVVGSREHHTQPTKEMRIPLRLIPKEETLYKLGNSQKLADQTA